LASLAFTGLVEGLVGNVKDQVENLGANLSVDHSLFRLFFSAEDLTVFLSASQLLLVLDNQLCKSFVPFTLDLFDLTTFFLLKAKSFLTAGFNNELFAFYISPVKIGIFVFFLLLSQ